MVIKLPGESTVGSFEPVGTTVLFWFPGVQGVRGPHDWGMHRGGQRSWRLSRCCGIEAEGTSQGLSLSSQAKLPSRQYLYRLHRPRADLPNVSHRSDPFQDEPVSSPSKVPKVSNMSHPSVWSTVFRSSEGTRGVSLQSAQLPSVHCLTSLNLLFPLPDVRESCRHSLCYLRE